ncbi:hypothetical protein [Comamonas sp. JC664]|uniref:hypothetical protein n=1 Tax=Comamonas sp. JC664 TaxID=2801917 RepID=UPI001748066D|nr:hypothetical protein [Comamonas sp. JC664]MBL0693828.1 hypothetical protein [Comamonas sp. JC664]GHG74641.1 hypothetical protein GCM10012319_22570 [Comamonas sp. KCTC 72670]
MQGRRFMKRAVLMAGLLAGCGGVEPADAEPPLDTREAALASCALEFWYEFYRDSGHTQLVGQSGCTCGGGRVNWGIKSDYQVVRIAPRPCP